MQDKKLTSVHSRLRSLANAAKLKNADLARIAEISPVAVGKWFNTGQTPKAEQLLKLARHFDVPMEWLLAGEQGSQPKSMDVRLDDVVGWLEKLDPEGFTNSEEKDATREFWRDIFEADDERIAATGSRDERPDVLVLSEMLEDSLREMKDAFVTFSDALGSVELTGDTDSEKALRNGWEKLAAAVKKLSRRQQSLSHEIRLKEELPPF